MKQYIHTLLILVLLGLTGCAAFTAKRKATLADLREMTRMIYVLEIKENNAMAPKPLSPATFMLRHARGATNV